MGQAYCHWLSLLWTLINAVGNRTRPSWCSCRTCLPAYLLPGPGLLDFKMPRLPSPYSHLLLSCCCRFNYCPPCRQHNFKTALLTQVGSLPALRSLEMRENHVPDPSNGGGSYMHAPCLVVGGNNSLTSLQLRSPADNVSRPQLRVLLPLWVWMRPGCTVVEQGVLGCVSGCDGGLIYLQQQTKRTCCCNWELS
jgi:hypothetical protein